MKKIITLCIFTFALLIGSQSSFAQEKNPEGVAKEKVNELNEELGLSGDQQGALWKALADRQTALNKSMIESPNFSEVARTKANEKINSEFSKVLSEILTKDQYKKYLVLEGQD